MNLSALPASIEVPLEHTTLRTLGHSLIDADLVTWIAGGAWETIESVFTKHAPTRLSANCQTNWSIDTETQILSFEIDVDSENHFDIKNLFEEMEAHQEGWGQTLLHQFDQLLPYCMSPSRLLSEISMEYWMGGEADIDTTDAEFKKKLREYYREEGCEAEDTEDANTLKPSQVRKQLSDKIINPTPLSQKALSKIKAPPRFQPLHKLLLQTARLPKTHDLQTQDEIEATGQNGPIVPIATFQLDDSITYRVLDDLFNNGGDWEPTICKFMAEINRPREIKRLFRNASYVVRNILHGQEILTAIQTL